jgi:hypothetical protein
MVAGRHCGTERHASQHNRNKGSPHCDILRKEFSA